MSSLSIPFKFPPHGYALAPWVQADFDSLTELVQNSGTVNTGNANTLAYYASSNNSLSSLTAITANRALQSNSSGLPTASSVTSSELNFVSGVTSSIQNQFNSLSSIISLSSPFENVKFYGATGNGVTDDTSAFISANGASNTTFLPKGQYALASNVFQITKDIIGSFDLSNILYKVTVNSNVNIRDIKFTSTGWDQITVPLPSISNINLDNIIVNGSGGAYSITATGAGLTNFNIRNSTISADGYGVLLSDNTNGSYFRCVNNNISSITADAVEVNEPSASYKNVIISGNFLSTTGGSLPSAGFGIGIAAVENATIIGNLVTTSRLEALHLEDTQKNITVIGNYFNSIADGLRLYRQSGNNSPIFIGNIFDSGTIGSNIGSYFYLNPSGSQSGSALIGNKFSGYSYGLYFGGIVAGQTGVINIASGNCIFNTDTAIAASGAASIGEMRQFGTNFASGVTTFFHAGAAHFSFGKMVSDTSPTNIITGPSGGYSGFLPSSCDGFAFPLPDANIGGAGTSDIYTLIPASVNGRFNGIIRIKSKSTSNPAVWLFLIARITWNGSTLIVSNQVTRVGTTISNPFLHVSSGNVVLQVTSSGSIDIDSGYLEFDGEYWDA